MSRYSELEDMLIVVARALGDLLAHSDIDYAVQTTANNNPERETLIFKRLDALAALNSN